MKEFILYEDQGFLIKGTHFRRHHQSIPTHGLSGILKTLITTDLPGDIVTLKSSRPHQRRAFKKFLRRS